MRPDTRPEMRSPGLLLRSIRRRCISADVGAVISDGRK